MGDMEINASGTFTTAGTRTGRSSADVQGCGFPGVD